MTQIGFYRNNAPTQHRYLGWQRYPLADSLFIWLGPLFIWVRQI